MTSKYSFSDRAKRDLNDFVVPRQSWTLEVDGQLFTSLDNAEAAARTTGKPIYCRLAEAQKETP